MTTTVTVNAPNRTLLVDTDPNDPPAVTMLRIARDILSEPDAWTKDTRARTASGNPCNPRDTIAVSWCLSGALELATALMEGRNPRPYYNQACDLLCQDTGYPVPSELNDAPETTHERMLAHADAAIASDLEKRAPESVRSPNA